MIGIFLRLRDFTYTSKYADLGETTIDRDRMVDTLRSLLHAAYTSGVDYRTVGITLGQLSPFTPRQLSVWDQVETRHEHDMRLSAALDTLRSRYGQSVIHQGYVEKAKRQDIEVLFEV